MRNLILNNCTIEKPLSIASNRSISIESVNSNFNLNYFGNGPILQQKIIELNKNYTGDILITTSAVIRIADNCECNKIILNAPEDSSIYFIGDISKIKVLEIKNYCNITSNFTENFSNLNYPQINIIIEELKELKNISFTGSFAQSNLSISSYTSIEINGTFNCITIPANVIPIPMTLTSNTKIKNINLKSNALITSSNELFTKLKDPLITPGNGHDKLVLVKSSYITQFTNGEGLVKFKIGEVDTYRITVSLLLNNEDIIIDSKNIIIN